MCSYRKSKSAKSVVCKSILRKMERLKDWKIEKLKMENQEC